MLQPNVPGVLGFARLNPTYENRYIGTIDDLYSQKRFVFARFLCHRDR
jgi:hypothetical protein